MVKSDQEEMKDGDIIGVDKPIESIGEIKHDISQDNGSEDTHNCFNNQIDVDMNMNENDKDGQTL